MWGKTTCCNMSLSSFKLETSFTMILYWCSPLPVRRLQPAESYNSLSFSSLLLEGSYNPLLLFIKHQMINKYTTAVTVHYRFQIRNYRANPEQLKNRKIQSTEHLKTGTQLSLLWPATRRTLSSVLLRPHAEILPACCVPTHCYFNFTAFFCLRDAPKSTVAPRPFLQGRTQNYYRAASVDLRDAPEPCPRCVRTQISRYCSASFHLRDASDLLLTCVPAHFSFTVPATLQIRMKVTTQSIRFRDLIMRQRDQEIRLL
jgi:hypothetical protein